VTVANKQWPPRLVSTLNNSLQQLADSVSGLPPERSIEEQTWLTRFLVVRTCGYLEQVVYEVLREYVREKSGGLVKSFATSWLAKTRNPTPENMLELVGRFDNNLELNLRQLLEDDQGHLYREISFLVDRRNKIAHGLNESVNARKALDLLSDVELVADWFLENLRPHL
jgi:hypothetical protein